MILDTLIQIIQKIKVVCEVLLKTAVPIAGGLIVSDILLGTNFGVLNRLLSALSQVGITKNLLVILIIVALVLWYERKK